MREARKLAVRRRDLAGAWWAAGAVIFAGGVAVRRAQRLYVVNDVTPDGTAGGQVRVFNAGSGAYVSDLTGMLSYPQGAAWNGDGSIYVSAYGDDAVHEYLPNGIEVTSGGSRLRRGGRRLIRRRGWRMAGAICMWGAG